MTMLLGKSKPDGWIEPDAKIMLAMRVNYWASLHWIITMDGGHVRPYWFTGLQPWRHYWRLAIHEVLLSISMALFTTLCARYIEQCGICAKRTGF